MSGDTITTPHERPVTPSRAARDLGLRRSDLDLAVHLGLIRTVPDEGGGGGRRVTRSELDRVRSAEGFPDSLLARVEVVGTAEAARLLDVPA
ncbi:DUF6397 family protein, partial [Streptomyces viridochromogenes]|uniref:DUF6397 family protein n=2 Tax=Streptomyces TaxID=1883 RepID=UPI00211B673B